MYQTYQYKVYTKRQGYKRLDEVLDMCRYLYNSALEERKIAWKNNNKNITLYEQFRELTEIRKEYIDWYKLSSRIGRGVSKRLDKSFNNFFKRVNNGNKFGYPRFKSHNRYNSIILYEVDKSMIKFNNYNSKSYIKIKGLPILNFKTKRLLPEGTPKTLVLTKRPTGWFVSMSFKVEKDLLSKTDKLIGIDMGVNKRIALSDGTKVKQRRVDERKKKRLQRSIARCKKGSNTRKKRVKQLAKLSYREQIANRNYCHRLTSELINKYSIIAIEDLNIKSMSQQYKKLNKSILEQTWGLIKEQLTYKAEWTGRKLVFVNPSYTSQLCNSCGIIDKANRQKETYKCACGYENDADINAALNILELAQTGGKVIKAPVGKPTESINSSLTRKIT